MSAPSVRPRRLVNFDEGLRLDAAEMRALTGTMNEKEKKNMAEKNQKVLSPALGEIGKGLGDWAGILGLGLSADNSKASCGTYFVLPS